MNHLLLMPAGLMLLLAVNLLPGQSYAVEAVGDRGHSIVTNCDRLIAADSETESKNNESNSEAVVDEPDCD
ncbi:MAG: hypothetical protein ACI9LO_000614 [Planctomycetota bacterium]|jgi:hypothetical protein